MCVCVFIDRGDPDLIHIWERQQVDPSNEEVTVEGGDAQAA
jgi:hypothetical protein